jgi:hypothetical protein
VISTSQQIINHVVVGVLAVLMLGGTIALLLIGKTVPEFLVGFDGVIVTAAFANGAFFVQARTALPTANALSDSMAMHHQLAMAVTQTANQPSTGTTVPTDSGSTAETNK